MDRVLSLLRMQRNHPKYYFRDGNIILQAENVKFNIHRYLVSQGTLGDGQPRPTTNPGEGLRSVRLKIHRYLVSQGALRDNLPRPATNPDEGLIVLRNDNPIPLPEVTAKQFECLLDVIYHPGLADPTEISSDTLMNALDISDRYSMEDVSVRIKTHLQSRSHNESLATSFAMLGCCVKHPNRFPRDFVLSQFNDICTNSERISTVNITGLSGPLTVHIIQGRELVREGQLRLHAQATPRHWPKPHGWDTYLEAVFPRTQAADGWQIGPVASGY